MPQLKKISLSVGAFILLFICAVFARDLPIIFHFNHEKALKEWEEKIFRNKVLYSIEEDGSDPSGFLAAKSEQASSGLIYKMKFNVKEQPMMSWWWRVNQFPEKPKEEVATDWFEKDDYAARVYVIFTSWNFMNIKSLEYVWDESAAEDQVMTSPYIDNIKLIVAQSGQPQGDGWVFEERNIYEDYKRAFGKEPPKHAGAIALMTDADNSLSIAEASYKDIRVGYRHGE